MMGQVSFFFLELKKFWTEAHFGLGKKKGLFNLFLIATETRTWYLYPYGTKALRVEVTAPNNGRS